MTGGSPPLSTYFYAMGSRSRPSKNSSGASRRTRIKRWKTGASTDPSEPNIFLDDRKEAEKWEHLEELRLWMKHVVGLLSDVVNNGLGPAYFVSIFGP